MSIYGGKTWDESYFLFDKVYNSYTDMLNDIQNIFVGRYVFVKYCNETLSADIRKKLENNGLIAEDENQEQYLENYNKDKNNGYLNSDRRIFRAVWKNTELIPQEIANLNIEVNSEDIEETVLSYFQKNQLSGPYDSIDDLPKNPVVNTCYLVKETENSYRKYYWIPDSRKYQDFGIFGEIELSQFKNELLIELGKLNFVKHNSTNWEVGQLLVVDGVDENNIPQIRSYEKTPEELYEETSQLKFNSTELVEEESSSEQDVYNVFSNKKYQTIYLQKDNNIIQLIPFKEDISTYYNEWSFTIRATAPIKNVNIKVIVGENYKEKLANKNILWSSGIEPSFSSIETDTIIELNICSVATDGDGLHFIGTWNKNEIGNSLI